MLREIDLKVTILLSVKSKIFLISDIWDGYGIWVTTLGAGEFHIHWHGI